MWKSLKSPNRRDSVGLLSIDAEKARALPGVVGVLTAADVPVNQVGHLIQDWDVMIAEGDITRCVGDAIALVVAKDRKTLERAKKLVKVEYEELEPVIIKSASFIFSLKSVRSKSRPAPDFISAPRYCMKA